MITAGTNLECVPQKCILSFWPKATPTRAPGQMRSNILETQFKWIPYPRPGPELLS